MKLIGEAILNPDSMRPLSKLQDFYDAHIAQSGCQV